MEYLRLAKSRENYDPNIRHCLYGLDADLIMLGLLSHEPHFALLREEVTFGRTKKKTSATSNPETQKFYLMHLSLMREYLDKEFMDLKGTLPFAYDLERLIDDFILMAFFVGNDFLPNLPGLHINEGALVTMFDVYKRIMPTQDGYLNEFGVMNLRRCQAYLGALGDIEKQTFESEQVDSKWLRGRMRGGDRQEHGHRGSKHHQQQPRFSGFYFAAPFGFVSLTNPLPFSQQCHRLKEIFSSPSKPLFFAATSGRSWISQISCRQRTARL